MAMNLTDSLISNLKNKLTTEQTSIDNKKKMNISVDRDAVDSMLNNINTGTKNKNINEYENVARAKANTAAETAKERISKIIQSSEEQTKADMKADMKADRLSIVDIVENNKFRNEGISFDDFNTGEDLRKFETPEEVTQKMIKERELNGRKLSSMVEGLDIDKDKMYQEDITNKTPIDNSMEILKNINFHKEEIPDNSRYELDLDVNETKVESNNKVENSSVLQGFKTEHKENSEEVITSSTPDQDTIINPFMIVDSQTELNGFTVEKRYTDRVQDTRVDIQLDKIVENINHNHDNNISLENLFNGIGRNDINLTEQITEHSTVKISEDEVVVNNNLSKSTDNDTKLWADFKQNNQQSLSLDGNSKGNISVDQPIEDHLKSTYNKINTDTGKNMDLSLSALRGRVTDTVLDSDIDNIEKLSHEGSSMDHSNIETNTDECLKMFDELKAENVDNQIKSQRIRKIINDSEMESELDTAKINAALDFEKESQDAKPFPDTLLNIKPHIHDKETNTDSKLDTDDLEENNKQYQPDTTTKPNINKDTESEDVSKEISIAKNIVVEDFVVESAQSDSISNPFDIQPTQDSNGEILPDETQLDINSSFEIIEDSPTISTAENITQGKEQSEGVTEINSKTETSDLSSIGIQINEIDETINVDNEKDIEEGQEEQNGLQLKWRETVSDIGDKELDNIPDIDDIGDITIDSVEDIVLTKPIDKVLRDKKPVNLDSDKLKKAILDKYQEYNDKGYNIDYRDGFIVISDISIKPIEIIKMVEFNKTLQNQFDSKTLNNKSNRCYIDIRDENGKLIIKLTDAGYLFRE